MTVTNLIKISKHDLYNFHLRDDDNTLDNLYKKAQPFIYKSDYEFEDLRTTRIRKIFRKYDERCSDERIQDPIQLFKISTILQALDLHKQWN